MAVAFIDRPYFSPVFGKNVFCIVVRDDECTIGQIRQTFISKEYYFSSTSTRHGKFRSDNFPSVEACKDWIERVLKKGNYILDSQLNLSLTIGRSGAAAF